MDKINFVDRNLEKPELLNRYKMNPVAGQKNVFDVSPEQGKIITEGTPIRAAELNKMQNNAESYIDKKTQLATLSQAHSGTDSSTLITPSSLKSVYNDRKKIYSVFSSSTSSPYLYVTDSYLNNVDGTEVVIQPSSDVTASNYTYLNLNGTSHIIVKPTGSANDYVTKLSKDVPYRLKCVVVNGYTRWVAMDYPTERYSFLGQARLALASDYYMKADGEATLPFSKSIALDTDVFTSTSNGVTVKSNIVGDLYLEHNLAIYFFTGTSSRLNRFLIYIDSSPVSRTLTFLPQYTSSSSGILMSSIRTGQTVTAAFDGAEEDRIYSQDYATYLQLKLYRKNY